MANAFDRAQYPTREPDRLVVGDRWTWRRNDLSSDYPVDSYTLSYEYEQHGEGQRQLSITATDDGSDYIVEVAYSTTTDYPVGTYAWAAYITRDSDSERIRITRGTVELEANLADSTHHDPRSYAQRQIDSLRATLERLNTLDLSIYSVSGRYVVRKSMADTRRELNHWLHVRAREINADRIASGLRGSQTIRVRMS